MSQVLIIDDDADTCEVLELLLRSSGFSVESFPDRDQAIKHLARSRPSVILMDLRVDGMPAGDFIAQSRKLHPHAPIFLMTGAANIAETAKGFGVVLIQKPFDPDVLVLLVKAHAGEWRN